LLLQKKKLDFSASDRMMNDFVSLPQTFEDVGLAEYGNSSRKLLHSLYSGSSSSSSSSSSMFANLRSNSSTLTLCGGGANDNKQKEQDERASGNNNNGNNSMSSAEWQRLFPQGSEMLDDLDFFDATNTLTAHDDADKQRARDVLRKRWSSNDLSGFAAENFDDFLPFSLRAVSTTSATTATTQPATGERSGGAIRQIDDAGNAGVNGQLLLLDQSATRISEFVGGAVPLTFSDAVGPQQQQQQQQVVVIPTPDQTDAAFSFVDGQVGGLLNTKLPQSAVSVSKRIAQSTALAQCEAEAHENVKLLGANKSKAPSEKKQRRRRKKKTMKDDDDDEGKDEAINITQYMCMPQSRAAAALGIRASTLSKRWKEAAENRTWPYRPLKKLDRDIMTIIRNLELNPSSPDLAQQLSALLKKRQGYLSPVSITL
jgi:hypothetical protein